jgi:hypothetical protein
LELRSYGSMLKANKISVGKGYYNNSKIIEINLIILLFVFGNRLFILSEDVSKCSTVRTFILQLLDFKILKHLYTLF